MCELVGHHFSRVPTLLGLSGAIGEFCLRLTSYTQSAGVEDFLSKFFPICQWTIVELTDAYVIDRFQKGEEQALSQCKLTKSWTNRRRAESERRYLGRRFDESAIIFIINVQLRDELTTQRRDRKTSCSACKSFAFSHIECQSFQCHLSPRVQSDG